MKKKSPKNLIECRFQAPKRNITNSCQSLRNNKKQGITQCYSTPYTKELPEW